MKIHTVSQASKYCKVAPKTIINWIEAGHINAYKTVGGHRRIKQEDLDHFLEVHKMPCFDHAEETKRNRILVVDDDRIIVGTIVQSLEEDPGDYEVISAAGGFEAGIQVVHFKPDLIILDIMMPDGLRGGGMLTSLLVLPLYIPVLIFGSGAVGAAATGVGYAAYILLLGAFLLFAIVLTPWIVGMALRISVE